MLSNLEGLTDQFIDKKEDEDSDVAPIGPIVDIPSKEELKKKEKIDLEKSVKLASSASESDTNTKDIQ